MKILKKIFSINKTNDYRILNFFGIKFKFFRTAKQIEILDKKLNNLYYTNLAKQLHPKIFGEFKNKHCNDSIVLCACGETLKYYNPIPDAKHLAINSAVLFDKANFEYIFMHDNLVVKRHKEILKNSKATKFCAYAINKYNLKNNTSTEDIVDIDAKRFFISDQSIFNLDNNCVDVINPDITNDLIYDRGGGTVFSALQFILHTNPKKLYIVGCDCTNNGYFFGNTLYGSNYLLPKTIQLWKEFAYNVKLLYPNIEIISINPVNLKGLFKDIYTQSYIDANPEIQIENIEIMKEEAVC